MNKSLARSAIAGTFVFLFVLVAAAGAQTYSVLTSFDGTGGNGPDAAPLIDNMGNVFGTTYTGGSANCGAVYEMVNNGGGSYTNNTLYDFACGYDGFNPNDPYGAGVVMDSAGNLYGTIFGATNREGVVYELVNKGRGSFTFKVIYAFTGGKGGSDPAGDLVLFKGSLYGVTVTGGGGNCKNVGCGTVYQLTKSGGKWVETVLHVFNNHGDGYWPYAGVALDSDGNIYGTTSFGGSFGDGTVFKLSRQGDSLDAPESNGSYKETILHSFHGAMSGCQFFSGVVLDSAGNLYGTASGCPDYGDGKVYQLKRSGNKYGFRAILTFNGANGIDPAEDRLAVDSAGNIYGTASQGGGNGDGTVFKLAAGSFLYTDLHDFKYNGTDGNFPGGVSLDSLGNLYGTTLNGGSNGDGTVWQIANP